MRMDMMVPKALKSLALVVATLCAACTAVPQAAPPPARKPAPPVKKPAPPVKKTVVAQRVPVPMAPPVRRPVPPPPLAVSNEPPPALVETIRALWAADDSKIGLAVIRADQNWTIQYRGDERFPQQSVSKLWVAIAVMDAIDKGRLTLDTQVTLRETDRTLFHQPIAREIDPVNGLRITIRELLVRAMTKSDNTANDFLSKQVGGPAAVRTMIAEKGLGNIRFGPGERDLQSGTAGMVWKSEYRIGRAFEAARAQVPLADRQAALERYLADPVDGAAPVAIARALLRLKRGDLLSRSSTAHLLNLMETSETGALRVKAGIPAGWRWAHKTGTGQNLNGVTAGFNDVGIMTAPDGTSYAIVILIGRSSKPVGTRQAFMQTVAASVAANHVTP